MPRRDALQQRFARFMVQTKCGLHWSMDRRLSDGAYTEIQSSQSSGRFVQTDDHAQDTIQVAFRRIDDGQHLGNRVGVSHARDNATTCIFVQKIGRYAAAANAFNSAGMPRENR